MIDYEAWLKDDAQCGTGVATWALNEINRLRAQLAAAEKRYAGKEFDYRHLAEACKFEVVAADKTIDILESRLREMESEKAALAQALVKHHKWHMEAGEMAIGKDTDGEWIVLNMSDEYADSGLCEITTLALSTLPDRTKSILAVLEAARNLYNRWQSGGNSIPERIAFCDSIRKLDEEVK